MLSRNGNKVNRVKASAAEGPGPGAGEMAQSELGLYLSACKFLDTALAFPPDRMPLFQM